MQLATENESEGASMLAIIQRAAKDPSCDVEKMERLLAMAERMQAKDAEKQFAAAFASLQSNMPTIHAVKAVPDKNGNLKYRYAPLEEIMPKVMPALHAHGFTMTFDSEIKDGRAIARCTIQHVAGHSRTNTSMARIGSGPPGSSEAQGDGAAATYAKRRALCDALSIVSEIDTDGRRQADAQDEGAPIDFAQAQTLRELVRDTGSDEAAFLKYAGASKYEEIGAVKYDMLFRALNAKARK